MLLHYTHCLELLGEWYAMVDNDVNVFISVLLNDLSTFLNSEPIKYLFVAMLLVMVVQVILIIVRKGD